MQVVVTADFHGYLPPAGVVPPCDLLLLAGDVLPASQGLDEFNDWLQAQPAKQIVGIAGNHDWVAVTDPDVVRQLAWTYLDDEHATVVVDEQPVKVWGSPRSREFNNGSTTGTDELEGLWATIPDDVEILMTHGPAHGVLDAVDQAFADGRHVGSPSLRNRLRELSELKLFVCGHIHASYGETHLPRVLGPGRSDWLHCVNASYVDATFSPGNPPLQVTL